MITLAVLTVGLLGSCSKINERIDDLEKKVDGLENEKIASIESQITGINSSISDLGTIRSNIQSLTDNAKAQGQDIAALQAADKALDSRIEELSKYVGDTLKAYATEEWVKATFSTLGQYKKTCDTIAKIDARIGALDENLSKKIADCADSLTTWINKQFEGYYTAAEMDAKTDAMQAEIDSARAANLITDVKADSLAVELAKVQTSIDSAKASLTAEYTAAIDTAITTLDGKLTKQIQDEIEKVNETVTALSERVGKLEFQVRDLLGRVGALEGMIQSVTILPAYSDGSVKVEDDTLFIECLVNPAKAVWGLTMKNFTVYLHEVATKAVNYREIKINDRKCFSSNPFSGTVSIKVPVKKYTPQNADDSSLVVALNVKYRHSGNLTSDYTTEFVKVKKSYSYVTITAKYDGDDKPARTLKWCKQNLAITASGKKAWKGGNASAVKAPGTNEEVRVGDYFQWAASYEGYKVKKENQKPDSLLIYTDFDNQYCGDSESVFTFRSAGVGSTYRFNSGTTGNLIGIIPYYFGSKFTKYASNAQVTLERTPDNDDAASIILGGNWRMPTFAEFKALRATTYWEWNDTDKGFYVYAPASGDEGGLNGKKSDKTTNVTGSYDTADALLFFPAAGQAQDTEFYNTGKFGCYLSSTLYTFDGVDNAHTLVFINGTSIMLTCGSRCYGFSIRPVSD